MLNKNEIERSNIYEIKSWLREKGGYCNCEILNYVEKMFKEDAII